MLAVAVLSPSEYSVSEKFETNVDLELLFVDDSVKTEEVSAELSVDSDLSLALSSSTGLLGPLNPSLCSAPCLDPLAFLFILGKILVMKENSRNS
jgi:hypothetical protein